MSASREIGQQSVWTATIKDDADALVDPETVVFKWKRDGEQAVTFTYGTDEEVARVGLGLFQFTSPVYERAGTWRIRVESTVPASAIESAIQVRHSNF